MYDLLLIDDEKLILWGLKRDLERSGYRVRAFESAEEALPVAEKQRFHAAVVDVRLPGMQGTAFLERLKQLDPDVQVIMVTAFADVETAVMAIRTGAFDFILKPFTLEKIRLTIQNALEAARLKKVVASLSTERAQRQPKYAVLGHSSRMREVIETLERIGKAGAGVVLLGGESGTGKGLAANALHQIGPRATGPFIEINCGAIPENLFESELLGHEKGAFTGATETKKGLMELADGGTLFLDEVGEMPLPIQTKFLKALEEQKIRRVGGDRPIQVDLNIIAATNRDLAQAVRDGEFREDLFYRLNVVPIFLPPLRERSGDAMVIASHFLEVYSSKYKRHLGGFSESAVQLIETYHWPGNIRELKNSIERAVILETGEQITAASLGLGGQNGQIPAPASRTILQEVVPIPESGMDLHGHLEEIERRYLQDALARCKGNQSQAAKLLGMTRDILRYRLKKYGLAEA
ncbi:MAG TPA: sigma-54 dependent transcriptional regulator [Candidatus Ozemobacteraceae bacterium]|nr:sigma-54 dependent transcriptional regulator [Candidatus Ozemobacteraceae bacterium]